MTATSATHGGQEPARAVAPTVVVFDVNETLSDMGPMVSRFQDVGAPATLAATWFAALLRDGFALTAAGDMAPFATIGAEMLRALLPTESLNRRLDEAVEHVITGFSELSVHPDVPDGIRALTAQGLRLVTLSNGSASVAQTLFARAGIGEHFERLLSVEDAGVWKPAHGSYAYAAAQCGVDASEMLLVAVHPWDIDGAHRAGLRTGYINRTGAAYPSYFHQADLQATSLPALAEQLNP